MLGCITGMESSTQTQRPMELTKVMKEFVCNCQWTHRAMELINLICVHMSRHKHDIQVNKFKILYLAITSTQT
ncbi:hypothetical protein CICLE_v10023195mg [Citrus x clementina]|uniref:Uncharacterized protein n=1 Tax=Citrus clementina TaxID=85681 RepID=V4TYG9_CITCL|nr:hypothetical protein CICLE_v10023195mg [Citrus x clementina]